MNDGELLRIAWQTTIVDVQPTSRYGEPGRAPDTAHLSTTIGLVDEGRVLRFPSTEPVTRSEATPDTEVYRWRYRTPLPFTQLAKNEGEVAELSVTILLPLLPRNDPVLRRWTVEGSFALDDDTIPVVSFCTGKDGPALGGRSGFAYRGTVDPEGVLDIIYRQVP